MLKKSLIGLVVLLFFTQAKELNTPLSPSSIKGGEWQLTNRLYLNDDRIDPLCIRLESEFDKYKKYNENIYDAYECIDNVLDNFEELKDLDWSEPQTVKLGDKNGKLLYMIAGFVEQNNRCYKAEDKNSDENCNNTLNMLVANRYHLWLNQNVQFQFLKLKQEVDRKLTYYSSDTEREKKLIRVSFPDDDPSYRLCTGYPKRIRPKVIGIASVNGDYTKIKWFDYWGRLFLYNDVVIDIDTGDGGETIHTKLRFGKISSLSVKDKVPNDFRLNCKFNFN